MPVSPSSFSMTAIRCPCGSLRMRFTSVVLPLPRNPVTIVTGMVRESAVVMFGMSAYTPRLGLRASNYTARMKRLLLALITGYRLLLSPLLGASCRFYPSCSAYASEAIESHGALRGTWLAIVRLLKCHPWHPGGVDQVPPRKP